MEEQMVTLETARKRLGQLVIAAANFDEVTVISKNGVPAAAIVPLRVLPLIQTAGLYNATGGNPTAPSTAPAPASARITAATHYVTNRVGGGGGTVTGDATGGPS